ncbi:hypothetical protein MUY27_00065 [Mucilaginibacter sp. RS28]|uniref:Uncharacterized protein n=1 Tax=Mucilaginibacter straminoryzae TaxID=2932774 RepID=A0A9X1X1Z4_9SPHI|nr:hypothetical protein [Mucilaginibacter straminoryzae]MCJ8208078.1 hypothetical protein [Mucilaginibacter straminoryzae]
MSRNASICGHGNSIPPILAHVQIYFDQKGMSAKEAEAFYHYQHAHGWKTDSGTPIKNWKVVAANWIWDIQRSRFVTLQLKVNRNLLR